VYGVEKTHMDAEQSLKQSDIISKLSNIYCITLHYVTLILYIDKLSEKITVNVSPVAHACILSYLGDGDGEGGSWFKASLGKKLVRPPTSTSKLGTVAHASHPSYARGIVKRESQSEASLRQKWETLPEK
jgi:hypothetical protein